MARSEAPARRGPLSSSALELLDRYGIRALPKPFDLDALLEAIAALLATRRSPGD